MKIPRCVCKPHGPYSTWGSPEPSSSRAAGTTVHMGVWLGSAYPAETPGHGQLLKLVPCARLFGLGSSVPGPRLLGRVGAVPGLAPSGRAEVERTGQGTLCFLLQAF